jgi:hypothetical protein
MKYLITVLFSMIFLGCSGQQMADNITKAEIALSGNKPPKSFKIANLYTMQNYVFNMQNYTIALPSAKEKDFIDMGGGWFGASHKDNQIITLHLDPVYHIELYISRHKYGENDKALENNDMRYFEKKYPQTTYKNGKIVSIRKHLENHGKENYICYVSEFEDPNFFSQGKSFSCYKFSPKKTKVKKINIRLIYTKPSVKERCPVLIKKQCDPNNAVYNAKQLCEQAKLTCSEENIHRLSELSKEYTYEDLQERAQHMLDSLYIKDGWDE